MSSVAGLTSSEREHCSISAPPVEPVDGCGKFPTTVRRRACQANEGRPRLGGPQSPNMVSRSLNPGSFNQQGFCRFCRRGIAYCHMAQH
jgi:hypothetical protein